MFITNITKSSEDCFRQAKILKVLLHLNDITVVLERHRGQNQSMGGVLQILKFFWPRRAT